MTATYPDQSFNQIYNLLFCDEPQLFGQTGQLSQTEPWATLLSPSSNKESLEAIAEDINLEARSRIVANNLLRKKGYAPATKELLGVIVEVGLDEGLDVLAAYTDGTARYLNHSGKMIVWETRSKQSDNLIDKLFDAGMEVVNRIGKWEKPRTAHPQAGQVKLTFLVSDGLYFGQGPFDALQADPMGGPVIKAATQLMIFLTSHN